MPWLESMEDNMAFDAKGYRSAALSAGVPKDVVEKTIADRTGAIGWLTGGKSGIAGVATGAGNILSLPSYAIGGVLNQAQRAVGSDYGQKTDATGLGVIEGIKNKRAVFTEAPETFGVDPNSNLGMGIGFAGELLTPQIPLPIGKIGIANNIFKKGSKAANIFSKTSKSAGNIGSDIGRTLLEKSYKLSASDIDKIAEAIGATDEASKAVKVIDYLEGLGLSGSNRGSLVKLNEKIDKVQKPFNKLTKTGTQVSRKPYIDFILEEAVKQERLGTPQSRVLSKQLFNEALYQEKLGNKALTDTELTKTISQLWSDVSDSKISDPMAQNMGKSLAKAGSEAREVLRPGSQQMGRTLRGMRTAQEVIGKKANTGLGTQLVNAFKPSAFGVATGAGIGFATGNDPIMAGITGAAGGMALNNPRVLNMAGKVISNGIKSPQSISKVGAGVSRAASMAKPITSRLPQTFAKVATQQELSQTKQRGSESQIPNSGSVLKYPRVQNQLNTSYSPLKKRNNFQNAISKRMGVSY